MDFVDVIVIFGCFSKVFWKYLKIELFFELKLWNKNIMSENEKL